MQAILLFHHSWRVNPLPLPRNRYAGGKLLPNVFKYDANCKYRGKYKYGIYVVEDSIDTELL